MKEFDPHLNAAWWALRVGLGVGPIHRQHRQVFQHSTKKDHLRVDVTGDVQGGTLKVISIQLL